MPYIYSHDELRRLLAATASFPNRKGVLEPATLRAILLLLYGAGLRRSEALSLTLADVDLTEAIVTIRQTKFYKTRLVPLGAQLHEAMLSYAAARATAGHSQAKETFFFVTRAGAQVPDQLLDRAFRRLRVHAGIGRTDGGRYGPRLHDLRHTFAVHRLTEWYRAGADVQRLLPQLATYLGHVNISGTQVYLSMTPELLREAAGRFEQYALKEESHA